MSANLDQRHLVPEFLDALPLDDARAVGSRRDLIWINALMLQSRIMAGLLNRHVLTPPKRILELGSGDGAFMLAVARRMRSAWRDVELVMVDQADLLTDARRADFARLGWRAEPIVADLFEWLEQSETAAWDVTCANLVLHHFSDAALRHLFALLKERTSIFVATEPRRDVVGLRGCSLLWLIGVNDVTMHDAAASVRAGFAGEELTRLWPATGGMRFEERRLGLFTHAFAAERAR
jgi:2-polyprenyl-3-methyl-5-hydroxy-6-metoxy-1,4-benzoquinol methylase